MDDQTMKSGAIRNIMDALGELNEISKKSGLTPIPKKKIKPKHDKKIKARRAKNKLASKSRRDQRKRK